MLKEVEPPDAAHTEDGYTRIANKLLEAMLAGDFTGGQLRTLLAIERMTYGWRRKTITISSAALAERAGLSKKSGRFRKELQELISEGVLTSTPNGTSKPLTYAIQKSYGSWGRFASSEESHRKLWDRDYEGLARSSSKVAPIEASPDRGVPPMSTDQRPHRGDPATPNSDSGNNLVGGKERKKSLRGEKVKREGFVSAFGADYKEVVKGLPPYARIGVAVNNLCAELSITPEEVRPAWQTFLRSPEQKYGPQYFAQNYGKYAPATSTTSRTARLQKQGYV